MEPCEKDFDMTLSDPAPQHRGKSTKVRPFRSLPILPVMTEMGRNGIWYGLITVGYDHFYTIPVRLAYTRSVMIDGPTDYMTMTVRLIDLKPERSSVLDSVHTIHTYTRTPQKPNMMLSAVLARCSQNVNVPR